MNSVGGIGDRTGFGVVCEPLPFTELTVFASSTKASPRHDKLAAFLRVGPCTLRVEVNRL